MPLTSHLKYWKQSPIGQFLREKFSQTASITKEANRQLRSASTILPADPALFSGRYGTLGMAIDYRIRYYFALTPSERFFYPGAAASSLAFRPWTNDTDIPVDLEEIPDMMGIFDFDVLITGIAQSFYDWKIFSSFFQALDAMLVKALPVGRRLDMDAEHLLVRYCYVLALLDAVGRSGLTEVIRQGPLFVPSPKKNAGELLAIPHDALVEDLRYMSWLFYDRCHDLLTRQHELNPGFAGSGDVGGADADLIVDGCLMELKASIHAKIEPDWLWQLAGYLLLDYDDAYHITTVGVYMVRQGLLLKWPVEEFLRLLTGHHLTSLTSLRQDFRSRFSTKPLLPRR